MANMNSRINQTIGFDIDRTGLNTLSQNLKAIQNMTVKDLIKIDTSDAEKELKQVKDTAYQIEQALTRSFDTSLGRLNISKFNQELKKSNISIKAVYSDLAKVGVTGQNAFRNLTTDVLTTNIQLKKSTEWLDKIGTTMANTIRWGITSSIWNTMTGSLSQAYGFAKKLDKSLNDIRIVTKKSKEEMDEFAVSAIKAAKELGTKTTEYTNASLIYYQQGLSNEEVEARTNVTIKAANATGQSAATISEMLTSVWNGYQVTAENAEAAVDKLAAVAATTAADLGELTTGMSKVASAANLMGVDIDQMNALLSTAISVTRQAPESVGTAFKTVFSRISDIEAGLDEEVSLGNYTEKLAAMGINVLNAKGQLRDLGDVIEEVGDNWGQFTREQQISLAQTMGGARQYNYLLATFDNWDKYRESLQVSQTAQGELQAQQDIYLEDLSAHLKQLEATTESLYNSLFNSDDIIPVIDAIKTLVSGFDNLIQSIGGAQGAIILLGSIFSKTINGKINELLTTAILNMKNFRQQNMQAQAEMEIVQQFGDVDFEDERYQKILDIKRRQLEATNVLSTEENKQVNETIRQLNEQYKKQDELQKQYLKIESIYKRMTGEDLSQIGDIATMAPEQLKAIVNDINTGLEKAQQQAENLSKTIFNKKIEKKPDGSVEIFAEARKALIDSNYIKEMTKIQYQNNYEEMIAEYQAAKKELDRQIKELSLPSDTIEGEYKRAYLDSIGRKREGRTPKVQPRPINEIPISEEDRQRVLQNIAEQDELKRQKKILNQQINDLKQMQTEPLEDIDELVDSMAEIVNKQIRGKDYLEVVDLLRNALGNSLGEQTGEESFTTEEDIQNIIKAGGGIESIQSMLDTLGNNPNIETLKEFFKESPENIEKFIDVVEAAATATNRQTKDVKEAAENVEKTAKGFQNATKGVEGYENSLNKFFSEKNLQRGISLLTNTVSLVNELNFAIGNATALPDIWGNNDLSIGEKIFQTITNIATATMTVFKGVKTFKQIQADFDLFIKNLTTSRKENAAAIREETAAIEESSNAQKNDESARQDNKQATEEQNAAIDENNEKVDENSEKNENNTEKIKENTEARHENNEESSEGGGGGDDESSEDDNEGNKFTKAISDDNIEKVKGLAEGAAELLPETSRLGGVLRGIAKVAGPLSIVVGILTALYTITDKVISYIKIYLDNLRKSNIEQAEIAIENANRDQEEIDKKIELKESYDELIDAFEQGKMSQLELFNAVKDLNMELTNEADALQILTGNYDELTRAVNNSNLELMRQKQLLLDKKVEAQKTKFTNQLALDGVNSDVDMNSILSVAVLATSQGVADMIGSFADILSGNTPRVTSKVQNFGKTSLSLDMGATASDAEDTAIKEELAASGLFDIASSSGFGGKYRAAINPGYLNNVNSQLEWYKKLSELQEELPEKYGAGVLENSELYKSLGVWLKDEKELIDGTIATIKEDALHAGAIALEEFRITDDTSYDAMVRFLDSSKSIASTKGGSGIEWEDSDFQAYIDRLDQITNGVYSRTANFMDSFTNTWGQDLNYDGLGNTIKEMTDQATVEFGQFTTNFTAQVQSLSNEVRQNLVDVFRTLAEEMQEAGEAQENLATTTSLIDSLTQQKELTEKEKETLDGLIADLTEKYPALAEQQDIYSKDYLGMLEIIQQKNEDILNIANQNAFNTAGEAVKVLFDELNKLDEYSEETKERFAVRIAATQESLLDAIKTAGDAYRKFSEQLTADIITDAEAVTRKTENMATALSKIKDGYKVAPEDVEEILNLFPELAQQAVVFTDGSILLEEKLASETLSNFAKVNDAERNLAAERLHTRETVIKEENAQIAKDLEKLQSKDLTAEELQEIILKDIDESTKETIALSAKEAEARITNDRVATQEILKNWQALQQAAYDYSVMARAAMAGEIVTRPKDYNDYIKDVQQVTKEELEAQLQSQAITKEQLSDLEYFEALRLAAIAEYQKRSQSIGQQVVDMKVAESEMWAANGEAQQAVLNQQAKLNDMLKEELDIYHDINIELQKSESITERLVALQERMAGNSLVKNLKQQTKELEKQISLSRDKQTLQYQQGKYLKGRLMGYGVTFDEDTITNYADILTSYQDKHNSLVKAGASDEEVDAAKQTYENLKEDIERYEELAFTSIPELYDEMLEKQYEVMEKQIEIFNEGIQIKLDAKQSIRDLNSWSDEVFDELDLFGTDLIHHEDGYGILAGRAARGTEDVRSYYDRRDRVKGTVELDYDKLTHIMENVELMNKLNADSEYADYDQQGNIILNQTKAIEDLTEAEDAVKTSMAGLIESMEQVEQAWNDSIDTYISSMQELVDEIAESIKAINHAARVNELRYGKSATASANFNQAEIDQNLEQLKLLQQTYETIEAEYKTELEQGNEDHARILAEKLTSLQSSMDSIVETNLQQIKANIINRVNAYYEDLQPNAIDNSEWEINQDIYKDRYDKTQQKLKLDAFDEKINAAMPQQDASSQAKLAKFQNEELKRLKEKDVLTKHEYERAEKRYDLLLKQIALEDAQNNKTKMRLKRDTQGNYSYQQIADEDAVAAAKQNVFTAQESLYTFDKDYLTERTSNLQKALQEGGQDLADALTAYIENPNDEQNNERLQNLLGQLSIRYNLEMEDFLNAKNFLLEDLGDIYATPQDLFAQTGIDPTQLGMTPDEIQNMDMDEFLAAVAESKDGTNYLLSTVYKLNGEIFNLTDTIADGIEQGKFGVTELGKLSTDIIEQTGADINSTITLGHQNLDLINGDLTSITNKISGTDEEQGIASAAQEISDKFTNWHTEINESWKSMNNLCNSLKDDFLPQLTAAVDEAEQLKIAAAQVKWEVPDYSKIGAAIANSSGIVPPSGGTGNGSSSGLTGEPTTFERANYSQPTAKARFIEEQNLKNKEEYNKNIQLAQEKSSSTLVPTPKETTFSQYDVDVRWKDACEKVEALSKQKDFFGWGDHTAAAKEDYQWYLSTDIYPSQLKTRFTEIWQGQKTAEDALNDFKKEHLELSNGTYKLKGFATGGYTGDNLPDTGALAILHKKELVLNAHDTENMLKMIEMVRQMKNQLIESNKPTMSFSIDSFMTNLHNSLASLINIQSPVMPNYTPDNTTTIEQDITINADFPNVTERNEIEQALQNLTSLAAQKAFNTRR